MKLKTLFALGALCALLSFRWAGPPSHQAIVQQEEGLYIYYRCSPTDEYTYLGTYKVGFVMDNNPSLLFKKLVKKAKEKYPNAQAIIIDNDMSKCDAVVYK